MQPKSLCFLLFIFLVLQCKDKSREVLPAFYHWQTRLELSEKEVDYLDSLKVSTLYAKFFDVDWDANARQPIPLALIDIKQTNLAQIQVIPTVFITNRTFLNIKEENIPTLAKKIASKIEELYEPLHPYPLTEIQLDCDWSPKTRDKYFLLLQHLQTIVEPKTIQLSATIRLHQVKFFEKTGVPPVQKGMLMFYNMGNLNDISTENSILDMNIAKDYFVNFDRYPLDLDLALPIFAWGVLIRDNEMIKLINNLRADQLSDNERFIKVNSDAQAQHSDKPQQNLYQVIKSTYLDGYYLYEGDRIRIEAITVEDLEEAARQLRSQITQSQVTISFYHLDTTVIKHYSYENLEKICQIFRQ